MADVISSSASPDGKKPILSPAYDLATVTNVAYGWARTYQSRAVTISHTSTNTWYVKQVPFPTGYRTPFPDGPNVPGEDYTETPEGINNTLVVYDKPAMALDNFTNNASNIGDYAYVKRVFTYSLASSTSTAYAKSTEQVAQIAIARRIQTNNVISTDWTNVVNQASTTNLPDCSTVTTNEIRNIIGPGDPIRFDPNITNNY